ncbi:MAG: aldolase [Planctomycetes bacterium]|jgi:L-fuculose-phosphate aldolase|nr:aldolase [Planctomycetota bacterium]MDP6408283.1 class II aldolase/adducin family protein [Planctomycetota bacterium]
MSIEQSTESHGWTDEEARLRKAICEIGALCYQKSFIVGTDGNISARLADGTLLITPAGAMKGFLKPEQMAHIDMQGASVDDGPRCSSETGIHLVSYEERPEMKAVLHCHPPHAVAMTIAGIDLQQPVIPEIIVTIGGIPTAPFGTPGTHELPETIRDIVRCSDTLVMQNHGSVTLGTNLLDAFKKLDMLEHTARILWLAHTVKGELDPLPPEAVAKLLDSRKALGLTTTNTLENRCALPDQGA